MARADKRATVREEAPLAEQRPVQLQAGRRFFSSGGSDRATREARALAQAFETGTQFFSEEIDRRNIKGQERALGGRAAGEERDVEDKNQGYNRAWDEMDAESDVNFMKKELPELLRGADWENLEEEAVSGIVSDYMKEQFTGIDPTGWYGQRLAPAMLAIEAETLATHRDMVLQRIQTEQRTTIFSNLEARFENSMLDPETPEGTFDYDYLGDQTNIFFDGAAKREVYWKTLYDFAIDNGRPDLITNAPERFKGGKGDPTGIDDPLMQDAHRAAINSATTQQAKMAKAAQDEQEAVYDSQRFNTQYAIYEGRKAGQNVDHLIRQLAVIPGTDFADISTSKGFGDSQLDERESRSPDMSFTSPLWFQIHAGTAGLDAIFFAHQNGFLGQGPQSEKLMESMMSTARSVQNAQAANSNPDVGVWRTQLNKNYNANLAGVLGAINPVMHQINVSANAFYTEQVANGESAQSAYEKTVARFDELMKHVDVTDITGITQPKPQTGFITEHVITLPALKGVAAGSISFLDAFAGVPLYLIDAEIHQGLADKTITTDEAAVLLANYN